MFVFFWTKWFLEKAFSEDSKKRVSKCLCLFFFVSLTNTEGTFWWSAGVDRPSKSREEGILFSLERTQVLPTF